MKRRFRRNGLLLTTLLGMFSTDATAARSPGKPVEPTRPFPELLLEAEAGPTMLEVERWAARAVVPCECDNEFAGRECTSARAEARQALTALTGKLVRWSPTHTNAAYDEYDELDTFRLRRRLPVLLERYDFERRRFPASIDKYEVAEAHVDACGSEAEHHMYPRPADPTTRALAIDGSRPGPLWRGTLDVTDEAVARRIRESPAAFSFEGVLRVRAAKEVLEKVPELEAARAERVAYLQSLRKSRAFRTKQAAANLNAEIE